MWRVRLICLPVIIVFGAVGVVQHHTLAFYAGLITGAFVSLWASADLAVPQYIERWREGAEGEKRTAKQLSRLGPGWVVRHDLALVTATSITSSSDRQASSYLIRKRGSAGRPPSTPWDRR